MALIVVSAMLRLLQNFVDTNCWWDIVRRN